MNNRQRWSTVAVLQSYRNLQKRTRNYEAGHHLRWTKDAAPRKVVIQLRGRSLKDGRMMSYTFGIATDVYYKESTIVVDTCQVGFRVERLIASVYNSHPRHRVSIDSVKLGNVELIFGSLPIEVFQAGAVEVDGPYMAVGTKVSIKVSNLWVS